MKADSEDPLYSLSDKNQIRHKAKLTDLNLALFLSVFILVFSWFFLSRFGIQFYVIALGALLTFILVAYASTREMSLALIFWMLSMAGFRTIGMIRMPVLPDMSIDRLLLIWVILVMSFKLATGGQKLKGPFTADYILFAHVLYVLVQLNITESHAFHFWVLSSLSPLMGFVYGKYAVNKDSEIRNILVFFFVLSIYFYIVSIGQHFDLAWLVWPKVIFDRNIGLFHSGRSRGPVLHPPYFGQLIAILLFVHLYFLTRVKKTGGVVLLFLSLMMVLLGFLYTFTRGPWVAAAVGVGAIWLLRRDYRGFLGILLVFGVIAGLFGISELLNSEFLQERVSNTGTIENRLGFLSNAFRMISDKPLFGIGYFRFVEVVGEYNQTTYIPFFGMIKKRNN